MGSQRIIIFLAIACWEGFVSAQGRVEYLTPPVGTITATPMVQPCGQFVIPAVIKPLLAPEPISELPRPPAMPDFDYPFYPPMGMPPIIFQDDDDDDWHHLLYFLIFALKNRRFGFDGGYNGYGGYNPPPMPYSFYPVPCGFDSCGCDGNRAGNNVNYIPYPVPVPMASPGAFADPNIYAPPGDDVTIIPSAQGQPLTGRDNEVTLLIRTEK